MRDPNTGVFAVLSIVLALAIKVLALTELLTGTSAALSCGILIAIHALSRLVAIAYMTVLDYAREDDAEARGKRLSYRLGSGWTLAATVGGLAPLLLLSSLFDWWFAALLIPTLMLFLILKRWFYVRLGGYTGDCLGAAQQLSELVLLLGFVALIGPV